MQDSAAIPQLLQPWSCSHDLARKHPHALALGLYRMNLRELVVQRWSQGCPGAPGGLDHPHCEHVVVADHEPAHRSTHGLAEPLEVQGPVHRPHPGVRDHHVGHAVRIVQNPRQADRSTPVPDHHRHLAQIEAVQQQCQVLRVAGGQVVPVGRLIRIAESDQVSRDAAGVLAEGVDDTGELGRGRRIAVHEHHGLVSGAAGIDEGHPTRRDLEEVLHRDPPIPCRSPVSAMSWYSSGKRSSTPRRSRRW
jgi:hypothetical protein